MLYPFFIAQLPELVPGVYPGFSIDEFDLMAQSALSGHDFQLLVMHNNPEQSGYPELYRKLDKFMLALKICIAGYRRDKLEWQLELPECDEIYGEITSAIPAAVTASPLSRERIIDNIIWRYLDDCATGHDFDFTACAVYREKLSLLQKYLHRDATAGEAIFLDCLADKSAQLSSYVN